jgi:hypothetical protein
MRRAVLDANGDLVVFGSDHDGDPYYGIHEAPGQEYAPNEALIIQAPVYVAALLNEVARLTAEVERLSAMEPRWVNVGGSLGVWRLAVNGQFVSPVQLEPRVGGEWYEWPACVRHPDLHTACRTACARLGLSYIAQPTENP